jgi:cobalamin biosynthesis protein CobD/CbiB
MWLISRLYKVLNFLVSRLTALFFCSTEEKANNSCKCEEQE